MTTSPFFNQHHKPESRLYEEIIIEQIKAFGTDVYYLPRKLVKEDQLFGEDILSEFNDAYVIEMYYENESIGAGEADALSKFGLELRDEAKFQVAKLRFEHLISLDQNLISSTRPNEGDLIYFPSQHRKKLFEITFVEEEEFERLHNIPVFTLTCKLFEYSNEALDTGIAEIDEIENLHSTNYIDFYDVVLEDGSGDLLLENGDRMLQESYSIETIDKSSVNDWLQSESDKIIDFTDSNPFGEI
jgi:hypothetical protein